MSEIRPYQAYKANKLLWNFLAASYEGGPQYKYMLDAFGEDLFITHELETAVRRHRRRRHATYKNYCKAIADKYRDYVFRQEVVWPDADGKARLSAFIENCDLDGTSLQQYCRNATKMMQVCGDVLVGFDSYPIPAEEKSATVSQAKATGQRLYLTLTDIRRLVDYESDGTRFLRVVIEETERYKPDINAEEETKTSYIQWTPEEWVRLSDKGMAFDKGDNEFGLVPYWRYRMDSEGASQVCDIAECSRKIFNLSSLLDEELYSRTFSQIFVTGRDIQSADVAKVVGGSSNLIFIPGENVSVNIKGADPEQAASILNAINAEIKEIWRQAGIDSGDPTEAQQPESGAARAWAFHSTEQQLAGIAESAEMMINNLLNELAHQGAIEEDVSPAVFPRKFDVTSLQEDVKDAVELFTLDYMPMTAKKEVVRRVVGKALQRVPDDVLRQINDEIDAMKDESFDFTDNAQNYGKE